MFHPDVKFSKSAYPNGINMYLVHYALYADQIEILELLIDAGFRLDEII